MKKPYFYHEADFAVKANAQASLLRLLQPLKPFYSDSGARLYLGQTAAHYETDSIPMEAFARPLWGLVPFWAGGGKDAEFERIYCSGLAAGADPEHPDYWHKCRDYDQKFCEMAVIAYGMLLTPEKVWDPLSQRQREHLAAWLWEINEHECCACNWQWFCILTNLALKVRGCRYSRERMESGLSMLEDYYDAGGWYKDGNGGDKDYYNPFVMVPYGLIYAKFMEREEPERCARFRRRAREFAKDFLYWFAPDGASLAYGRSMTYRFAQAAFFSLSLLCGEEVLPLPVVKGVIVRHLTWWLNQPIYDNAGILTIGYAYPNLQMSESYNAPGSPYWALKAFAFLALPDDHPFWAAPCLPLPELERNHFLRHAGMLIQHGSGNAVALVPGRHFSDGHSHSLEKYSKFAYSSRFSFSISRSNLTLEEFAPDSTLAFRIGNYYYCKDVIEPDVQMDASGITVRWSPFDGVRVTTRLEPTQTGHCRIHTVDSVVCCTAYDCGFALPAEACTGDAHGNEAIMRGKEDYCRVSGVGGRGEILVPNPNTNLIFPKTKIPMAVYEIHPGRQILKTEVSYL